MASSFEDDDDFDEYNPHPYQGGYDIALTYGSPLPPSSATCYPIDGVLPASFPPPVSTPTAPVRSSNGDGAVVVPDQPQQVDLGYPWYDHLASGSFGFGRGCWDYSEENSHWRPLRRALDYLFGYSQGFGERRIGVDSNGIPIYANKKHGREMALSVQVQPAISQKIELHEWPLVNGKESAENAEIENHANEKFFLCL
ncbi:putative PLD-regulated protein1 [Dioscorea sansibarensis]